MIWGLLILLVVTNETYIHIFCYETVRPLQRKINGVMNHNDQGCSLLFTQYFDETK